MTNGIHKNTFFISISLHRIICYFKHFEIHALLSSHCMLTKYAGQGAAGKWTILATMLDIGNTSNNIKHTDRKQTVVVGKQQNVDNGSGTVIIYQQVKSQKGFFQFVFHKITDKTKLTRTLPPNVQIKRSFVYMVFFCCFFIHTAVWGHSPLYCAHDWWFDISFSYTPLIKRTTLPHQSFQVRLSLVC